MSWRAILGLFQETFKEWSEDKASRLAAALAYYTIFSIAPLLIIVIAVVGAVFGEEAARGEIFRQIQGLVGTQGAKFIETAIQNANQPTTGTIASLISILVLLLGATGLFTELQDALNTIWEVKPKPGRGVNTMVRQRVLSFTMVLGIGFLLLVSLVISAGLSAIVAFFSNLVPGVDFLWQIVNFLLGFAITTVLFGLIFKVLPDVKITWGDVLIGASITSLLFSIGRFLLGQYLGNGSFGSTYGAAGSLVVILAWIYYAAQILFFGAEFTQVYARRYGSGITPTKHAVPLNHESSTNPGIQDSTTNQPRISSSRKQPSNLINRIMRSFTKPKGVKKRRRN
ncbi:MULTISPECIES: YihY/virulence factor BrkB family protein [unclassified Tolypothrix]|uniref:YihY/virulence factor BrkB family protein n=1 Tax=unclassified Tolypothrix TaxID=2649714 RepID=UPI0005EAC404|nr:MULTISPECIES: YihY/virulence factor BrkB family protein [unclassified Tolypothrix]BAY90132.1 putative ribonuclease BN [Microchaete diplosiphon NIES-3275]EKE97357.1 ribonuclease BN [Tolypothrix sp. PCC 7601]MBE9083021.1 YihY/virulence factor BrkB family protein [Tolypothrix sp. LEGE 11397]UYD24345.1 YihY/virulence factor BrkB family protein [Tolypothrix sp. PCC 7712]UYD33421.1 YihY/virulence factor BrkB family protein [Tolypothrix sp. PCC 7601]